MPVARVCRPPPPPQVQIRAVRWDPVACTSGFISPTGTPTVSPTASITASNTATPSITASNTATPSITASNTASLSITRTPSITPSPSSSPVGVCNALGVIGTGTASSTGDGGQGASATLNNPFGVATDGTWLYVTEEGGMRVRRFSLASGIISTFAGTGSATGTYAGVIATSANVGAAYFASILPSGDVAIGTGRCLVIGVTATTQMTYALAGNGSCISAGATMETGVPANATWLGIPRGAAVWGSDGVFVSTGGDHRIVLLNLTTGAWS